MKAKEQLHSVESNNDKYRLLFEHVHDGIYQSSVDGRILTANPALVKMLGYDSEAELMKMNIADDIYVNPSDREKYLSLVREKGSLDDSELIFKKKDGSQIIVLEHSHTICNNNGEVLCYEGTLRDITERKKTEEDLMLLKHSVDIHYDGAFWMDREGRFIYVNDSACIATGYKREELIGQHVSLLNPQATKENMALIWDHLEKNGSLKAESIHIRKDGTSFPVEIVSSLVRFAGKEYNCGFARDISERRRNAEDLQLGLDQLRQIIDLVPSYIFAKDVDGQFLLVNKALAEVFGMDPSDIKGKTDKDYGASEEQIKGYRAADLTVIEGGTPLQIPEEQVRRKDGTLGWFQTVKIPYKHPGWNKPAILGVATEITERKQIEDELRKSEERFRKLFELHTAVKLMIDLDNGEIVDANNAAAEYYGFHVHQLRKMTLADISTISSEKMQTRLEKAKNGERTFFESVHRLSDGSLRDVEIFTSRIDLEGHSYLHSIVHDITEKKKILTDLIVAKEKAEESDKLKTAFLHNISHEIRTPMNAIVGFNSLLESSELSGETRKQYVDIVSQSCNQLLSIISDIVEISNIETGLARVTHEKVNLRSLISNLYEQYSLRARLDNISFIKSIALDDSSALIISDEVKLIQVISNLLNNSFKFTKKGSIEFGYTLKDDFIQFFVKDTGIGISDDNQSKIFDRFFQVENSASYKTGGTGLGLSISKAYVELMGGKIWTISQPGKGSTFYFTLPYIRVDEDKTVGKQLEKGVNIDIIHGKSILIAEDNDFNFLLLNEMLAEHNINIIRALNGIDAVNACDNKNKIDLVLMDIKMPGMDGYSATAQIRKNRPEIPVIAVTAYVQEIDREKILASGFSGYISKPIDKNQLQEILETYLVLSK